jgi:pantetheine-phosphate adenylyltransferase
MNHHLSGIETIFIPTSPKYSFIHSKLVREVAQFGGDVSAFVPKVVAEHLAAKFEAGQGGAGQGGAGQRGAGQGGKGAQ